MTQLATIEKINLPNPELARQLAALLLKMADPSAPEVPKQVVRNLELSIIFPIYNEEENIPLLYQRVVDTIEANNVRTAELIFVNDGSSDRSEELIRELKLRDDRVKLVNFSRNFGHQAAITAGINLSSGDAVILMDADLQDPPHVVGDMLREWRAGAEIVYAVRKKRDDDTFFKRMFAYSFYRLLQYVASIEIPLDTGDFCLLDKKVVNQLKSLPERNRFLRGLRSWLGFRQVAVEFERPARNAGEAKYTFRQSLNLAINGIIGFSTFPLRLAVFTGFASCVMAFFVMLYALGAYIFEVDIARGWTSLVFVVLAIGGVQLILLGSIGEYIGRIYDEVKQRPNYVIREFLI